MAQRAFLAVVVQIEWRAAFCTKAGAVVHGGQRQSQRQSQRCCVPALAGGLQVVIGKVTGQVTEKLAPWLA